MLRLGEKLNDNFGNFCFVRKRYLPLNALFSTHFSMYNFSYSVKCQMDMSNGWKQKLTDSQRSTVRAELQHRWIGSFRAASCNVLSYAFEPNTRTHTRAVPWTIGIYRIFYVPLVSWKMTFIFHTVGVDYRLTLNDTKIFIWLLRKKPRGIRAKCLGGSVEIFTQLASLWSPNPQ